MKSHVNVSGPGRNRAVASRGLSILFLGSFPLLIGFASLGIKGPVWFGPLEATLVLLALGVGAVLMGLEAFFLYGRRERLWLLPLVILGLAAAAMQAL